MKRIIAYKKSILYSIGFLFLCNPCTAQDINRIEGYVLRNELAIAKEAADSAASIYRTAPAFLEKAQVYAAISKDPAAGSLSADPKWEAFQALKNATEADAGYVNSILWPGKYSIVFELFSQFVKDGIVAYNAAAEQGRQEGFARAFGIFKKSETVSQFIVANNWAKLKTDTLLLFYLSKSAINAGKEDNALFYSKKIIDSNMVYLPFKLQYQQIFEWIVFYYKERQDASGFNRYLQAGKDSFPQSGFFMLAELDWFRLQKQYMELFDKYRELVVAGKADLSIRLAYCKDMFAYLWPADGKQPVDKLVTSREIISELTLLVKQPGKTLAANARLLMAKVYINLSRDLLKDKHTGKFDDRVYQSQRRRLLSVSNKYLTEIIADKSISQLPVAKESAALLQQIRRH